MQLRDFWEVENTGSQFTLCSEQLKTHIKYMKQQYSDIEHQAAQNSNP